MADQKRRAQLAENSVYSSRRPFKLYCDAIWVENHPERFQRARDVFLTLVRWQISVVRLEDLVVFSKWSADHIEQARRVKRLL